MKHDAQLDFALGTSGSQRWKAGRVSYRPPGEVFDPRFAAAEVIGEQDARRFVQLHHYSRSFPAARLKVGLLIKKPFHRERLCGVAVFSHPMHQAVPGKYLGVENPLHGVELGRLVLLDDPDAATNAESWLLSRAMKLARQALANLEGVVAFCDPVERRDADGTLVKRGHAGVCYQATNASFCGRSRARNLLITPAGRVLSERSISKLRNGEVGAEYVERQLRDQGAPARGAVESPRAYIERLTRDGVLRTLWHPGNLAFTWRFKKRPAAGGWAKSQHDG